MTQYDSATGLRTFGIETRKVEYTGIGQVRGLDVSQRGEDGLRSTRIFLLPVGQHALDLPALRVVLRPAQLAGNDRKVARTRISFDLRLGHVRERPDHDVLAVFGEQLGRH